LQGSPSGTGGIVAARLPTRHRHWQRVGSRAAAGNSKKTRGSGMSSSPLSSYAGGDLQQQQERNN